MNGSAQVGGLGLMAAVALFVFTFLAVMLFDNLSFATPYWRNQNEGRPYSNQHSPILLFAVAILFLTTPPVHAQSGAALFKEKCAPCHGTDGKGDNAMVKVLKVRDLSSDDVQKQTDAQLTEVIENGKGKMPAYKGKLTDAQIKQLVNYIRSLKK